MKLVTIAERAQAFNCAFRSANTEPHIRTAPSQLEDLDDMNPTGNGKRHARGLLPRKLIIVRIQLKSLSIHVLSTPLTHFSQLPRTCGNFQFDRQL